MSEVETKRDMVAVGDKFEPYANGWENHRDNAFGDDEVVSRISIVLEDGDKKILKVKVKGSYQEHYLLYDGDELVEYVCPYEPSNKYKNEEKKCLIIPGRDDVHVIWIDDFQVDKFYIR
jgi:hypothetical protein